MVPTYNLGSRKEQVKHRRLRLAVSSLNYDLFRRQLLEDPVCSCAYTAEISEHFLLHCPLYNSIRNKTINKLDENERNIDTLLFGNDQLHLETNKKLFLLESTIFGVKLTACKSVKVCLNVLMIRVKEYML